MRTGTRSRRTWPVALAGLLLAAAAATPAHAAGPPVSAKTTPVRVVDGGAGRLAADPIAHDPTIIRQGRYYHSFITGDIATRTYLPMRRSTDLVHWEFLGTVFTTPPEWVVRELGVTPGDFWAPDISFFDGEYHLYYAASSFGTNNSVIGLATNRTLDPDSPDYRWVDHGMVLRSRTGDDYNAIDPDLIFDARGRLWMSFGSFWEGIRMRRLDPRTGMPSTADPTLYPLASRGGGPIEGPSILRRGGYYYLFVSFDFCCRGVNSDYRVMVGRSRDITGPYVDRAGVPLLNGGGTELLRGYNEFRGPGHGDVFRARGATWFAHHYYDALDGGAPRLSIRRISWDGGWPRLGDPLSGSVRVGHGDAYARLVHRPTGALLDNPTCGYEGADIRLGEPSGGTCQQWRVEDRGGGYASVTNRFSNKVAEVAACVNAEGARVAQWGWLDNDCQKFRFVPAGDGWLRVQNRLAGRVLAPAACASGAPVQTFTASADPCQEFRLEPVGALLLADTTGRLVLSIDGAAGRLWRFVHIGEGYYRIVNRAAGGSLTTTRRGDGPPRLVLDRSGRLTAASQWRIEPLNDGGYRLVNRAGQAAQIERTGAGAGPPGAAGTQRILLLTP